MDEASAQDAQQRTLARNVDAALESVEEILTALLDMSRLDSGAMKAEISNFRIEDMLRQLRLEFAPQARERGLELIFVKSSATCAPTAACCAACCRT